MMTSRFSCPQMDEPPREQAAADSTASTGFAIGSRSLSEPFAVAGDTDDLVKQLAAQPLLAAAYGKLPELKLIAGELFGRSVAELRSDPEIGGLQTIVITASFEGTSEESRPLRREWHRRIHGVVGEAAANVQLLIDLRPGSAVA